VVKKAKKNKTHAKARETALRQRRAIRVKVIVAGAVIFFLVFFPNIGKAQALASQLPLIDHAWYSSLLWLKDSTPEPFDDPDSYYELYEPPSPGESFKYPETAYGVLSWWDYGHWITRIAHRMPISNPFQAGASQVARFFTAQDEDSANQMMDKLGSKYVIIDYQMPTTKFYAMPEWTGSSSDQFYEVYYQPAQAGKLEPIPYFYATYYRSTVVRLYNFDGEAVEPEDSIIVISWEEKLSQEGVWYKEITSSESFSTYEEAEAYISSQELGNYKIVGTDPFTCPVPLEEMTHYRLVYSSPQKWQDKPAVKIFEYVL